MDDLRRFCRSPTPGGFSALPLDIRHRLSDEAARRGGSVAPAVARILPPSTSRILPESLAALSVRQPAADMLMEEKGVENRSSRMIDTSRWHMPLACLICASAGAPLKVSECTRDDRVGRKYEGRELPRGVAVGAVLFTDVVDARDAASLAAKVSPYQRENFVYGPWVLVAKSAMRLPVPVPVKGRLGFYTVPVEALGPTNVDALERWIGTQPEAFSKRRS